MLQAGHSHFNHLSVAASVNFGLHLILVTDTKPGGVQVSKEDSLDHTVQLDILVD